jgi:hypothetical protein
MSASRKPRKLSEVEAQNMCDEFNSKHPEGTQVRFWSGVREGDGQIGTVSYGAHPIGNIPGVYVEDRGFIAMTHIEVLPQEAADERRR